MVERDGCRKLMHMSELSIVAHMSRPVTRGARNAEDLLPSLSHHFPQTAFPLSAPSTLRSALASVDEAMLAAYLRVSIPTLRRYASGELNMNWVICICLAVLPNVQASK